MSRKSKPSFREQPTRFGPKISAPTLHLLWGAAALLAWPALAQTSAQRDGATAGALAPVVITGSSAWQDRWLAPGSVDVVDGDELRAGQLQINLSEGLGRVPGLVVRNRQNYAQDLQISMRGYGARAPFGVRGVRLYVDGIPASAPDGQGQAANFPLGSADRIEVIRGPFSALYGASAGGVIALYTQDGKRPTEWRTGVVAGAEGLWRFSTQLSGQTGGTAEQPGWSYTLDAGKFATDGERPQSAASRSTGNVKLSRAHDGGRTVLVLNRQSSQALDPLGLTRAEFDANPDQTSAAATQFNTRKSVSQTQVGLAWEQALGNGHRIELMGYGGQRAVRQFQAIPTGAQIPAGSAGGVIDLDRDYWGWNARWRLDRTYDSGRLTVAAGLASDQQTEDRLGFENFVGSALGVQGRLRRDETNRASTLDPYVQAEWRTKSTTVLAGLRHSSVRFKSSDRSIAAGNPDDSGTARFDGFSPVLGIRRELTPQLQAFASVGRGLETPTLNEVAYRASGLTGLNGSLNASRSLSAETGLRGKQTWGTWSATLFETRTQDEIVVLSNTGGRSTFQNAGRTRRHGLELAGLMQWGPFTFTPAFTWMDARYRDGFLTCTATPCAVPNVPVAAGSRLPGLARQQAYLQVAWEPGWANSVFTLEALHTGRMAVNDRNTDFTAASTVFNLGVRFEQNRGDWTWREFVRVDNLTDRRYAGSVIVNEGNNRFFEPGGGRALAVGVELVRKFR
ncbi:TonB-dependent receptor domain-containing protein [Hydrogenophaga sp.]|uniref:TonB-dependent receptor family protein n=1 Tax=Hydrogenophaga sp. TaxID=1904254 RepID=UPI0027171155|nr:TonB-dependent receptor [Hydrogenophaga sp.]MDO9436830.1 TonB-dependent receptor [Hydrogenophaga sp.]